MFQETAGKIATYPLFSVPKLEEVFSRLRKVLSFAVPLAIGAFSLIVLFTNARFLNLDDHSIARRGLLLLGATDQKWTFTLAYSLLGSMNRFWADNIFYLRMFSIVSMAFGAILFSALGLRSLNRVENKAVVFVTLFLGGLGVLQYSTNSLPEYDHLVAFCSLCIGSIVVCLKERKSSLSWPHRLLLGVFLGLFLATNLPSGLGILTVFCAYWFLQNQSANKKEEVIFIFAFSLSVFASLWIFFNGFDLQKIIVNPGINYNELALKTLGGEVFSPSNLLYLFLRTITFSVELCMIVFALGGFLFAGRWASNKSIGTQSIVFLFPLLWSFVAAGSAYVGFDAFQTPDRWDFSPAYFWGKFIWYGYATILPVLTFIVLFVGLYLKEDLSKRNVPLALYFLLVVLVGCFGSGARIVHKAFLYEWCLLYVFFLFYQDLHREVLNQKLLVRISPYVLMALVVVQFFGIQVIPIETRGGVSSYRYSLDDLPRGKGLLVKEGFSHWIHSLSGIFREKGVGLGEKVISNDFVALYLLGFHHATPDSREDCCRFGLLKKTTFKGSRLSQIKDSYLLKILGPPDLSSAIEKREKNLESFFQAHFQGLKSIERGDDSTSLVFQISLLDTRTQTTEEVLPKE